MYISIVAPPFMIFFFSFHFYDSFQKFEYPLNMFVYRNKCLSLLMYLWKIDRTRGCFRDFQVKTHVQTALKVYDLSIDLYLFYIMASCSTAISICNYKRN